MYISVSIVPFVAVVMFSVLPVCSQDYCDTVKNKCIANLGCGMALHTFYIACSSLLSGESPECSSQCEKALISLVWAEDTVGKQFINCNCSGGDKHCEDQKMKIEVCENVRKFNKSAIVKCGLAKWLCEADTECLFALKFFEDHCSGLIRGEKCTPSCNNSLTILYQLQSAQKMMTCECDGTEDFKCMQIRRYTERLCFFKEDNASSEGIRYSTPCKIVFLSEVLFFVLFIRCFSCS
ncbi:uncharacterized protein LOC143070650 [Mytilus galloprovincialis]|uniref:uncharacterized protein LOC143070650 n=1 Tax=Mytilus galloprovincialis TaxID=29158 RepID=UPI003F7C5D2C